MKLKLSLCWPNFRLGIFFTRRWVFEKIAPDIETSYLSAEDKVSADALAKYVWCTPSRGKLMNYMYYELELGLGFFSFHLIDRYMGWKPLDTQIEETVRTTEETLRSSSERAH